MNSADPFFPPRPTALAHGLLEKIIREGDAVVDATAGNGHDTLFLARCVGESGVVHAFDILPKALEAAAARIQEAGFSRRVRFVNESHALLAKHLTDNMISVVMFNLGYLPGGDHAVTTAGPDTLAALDAATRVLKSGGVLSVVCYPGHDGGADEAAAVTRWMERLPENGWRLARYQAIGTRKPSPFLLIATKR
jgi:ubiquinone/menaquinone biosynthesis C-methylase UbiE